MTILDEIVAHKRSEVEASKSRKSLAAMKSEADAYPSKPRGFKAALEKKGPVAVIAEIKKKSPSKGILRENFSADSLAFDLERAGASALSVLTDEKYFGGSLRNLELAREAVKIPLLRKDFIVDEYQIYEAKAAGADAILLIAEVLSRDEILKLKDTVQSAGLDPLIEVHNEAELEKLRGVSGAMIGINNRDLRNFEVTLETTRRLAPLVPKGNLIVSESGIQTAEDLKNLKAMGVGAALVGESLMTQKDPGKALKTLLGK